MSFDVWLARAPGLAIDDIDSGQVTRSGLYRLDRWLSGPRSKLRVRSLLDEGDTSPSVIKPQIRRSAGKGVRECTHPL
jgi:hypothetical protein